MLTPEHVALAALAFALTFAPVMIVALVVTAPRGGKAFPYFMAAVLTACWLPLVASAPLLFVQLS